MKKWLVTILAVLPLQFINAEKTYDFNFVNTPLQKVVKRLTEITGRQFVFDAGYGNEKLSVISRQKIPATEVFNGFLLALSTAGFTTIEQGVYTKIVSARDAQRDDLQVYKQKVPPATPQRMVTWIYEAKYVNANEVFKNLRMLVSKNGEMNSFPRNNALIFTDWASNIQRINAILEKLDVPQGKPKSRAKRRK